MLKGSRSLLIFNLQQKKFVSLETKYVIAINDMAYAANIRL